MSFWKTIAGRWGSSPNETDEIRIDPSTNTLQTIDLAHHEIHSGLHYFMEGFIELDDTETFYVKLVTPDTTKWSHFTWDIQSSGILTTYLDEGASGGMLSGTNVTPLNNNRNSVNTSAITITSNVTAASGYTTRISQSKWGVAGGRFSGGSGGDNNREDEIILKQNTTYLRTFISGEDSNIINFKANWYEHTDEH